MTHFPPSPCPYCGRGDDLEPGDNCDFCCITFCQHCMFESFWFDEQTGKGYCEHHTPLDICVYCHETRGKMRSTLCVCDACFADDEREAAQ
jgi:hypothetical protein